MPDLDTEKAAAARRSLEYVQDGMVLGLGTGSTASLAVTMIGDLVRQGWRLTGVATSTATTTLARQCGIPVVDPAQVQAIDLTIDGADEVLRNGDAVKGAGGALVREKIVASASERVVFIVDSTKLVQRLGGRPIPFEVVPFGASFVQRRLSELGFAVTLRRVASGEVFRSDNGNHLLDALWPGSAELPDDVTLRSIAGVVDHGIFRHLAHHVIVGRSDGVEIIDLPKPTGGGRVPRPQ